METNVNRLEKPDSEKVDGGCLPDWEVADLPALHHPIGLDVPFEALWAQE